MLSTLRGSTSTRRRLPNTTCSTTPPKRSASSAGVALGVLDLLIR